VGVALEGRISADEPVDHRRVGDLVAEGFAQGIERTSSSQTRRILARSRRRRRGSVLDRRYQVSIQAAPQSDAESSREGLLIDASIDAQMSRQLLGSPPIGGKARCARAPSVICPEFETDLLTAQMIARASPGTDRHAENE
jgi:hypothetical protein